MDFSIVIPTYNRPDKLRSCLKSAVNQKLTGAYEIIVVDDGGSVDLSPIIGEFGSFKELKLLTQTNSGPAKARNLGAKKSTGKMIAFLDDDCQPDPYWLENLRKYGQSENVIIGGKTINHFTNNLYSEASQILVSHLYRFFKNTNQYFFTSNNFAVCRQTFFNQNGFDVDFNTSAGEDREFCVRALNKGVQLKYVPEAIVYHFHFMNFRQFCRMHFKYGTSAPLFAKKINDMGVNLTIIDNKFYTQLVYYMKTLVPNNLLRRKLLAILALSQIMNTLGNIWGMYKLKLGVIKPTPKTQS